MIFFIHSGANTFENITHKRDLTPKPLQKGIKMIQIYKARLYIVLIILVLFSPVRYVYGEKSPLGEKLLDWVESLPPSYVLIYSNITPIDEKNYNYWGINHHDWHGPAANIDIFLYVRTPEKRVMEKCCKMYDLYTTRSLLRNIRVVNRHKAWYYVPDANQAHLEESFIGYFYEKITIMSLINPLAGIDAFYESRDFIRNNYSTNGNELRFPKTTKPEPVLQDVFVMPENKELCPPIEKLHLSKDGKTISKFSITSKDYFLSNGKRIIFPIKIVHSWGENFEYKSFFDVIYFDVLKDDIGEDLYQLNIPDGAWVIDKREDNGSYYKNSKEHLYLEKPKEYPTKFSYFGFSLNKVEEMIDKKINEDRKKWEEYFKNNKYVKGFLQ